MGGVREVFAGHFLSSDVGSSLSVFPSHYSFPLSVSLERRPGLKPWGQFKLSLSSFWDMHDEQKRQISHNPDLLKSP